MPDDGLDLAHKEANAPVRDKMIHLEIIRGLAVFVEFFYIYQVVVVLVEETIYWLYLVQVELLFECLWQLNYLPSLFVFVLIDYCEEFVLVIVEEVVQLNQRFCQLEGSANTSAHDLPRDWCEARALLEVVPLLILDEVKQVLLGGLNKYLVVIVKGVENGVSVAEVKQHLDRVADVVFHYSFEPGFFTGFRHLSFNQVEEVLLAVLLELV